MSVVQPPLQERRPSPNVALNLASNNPFRQRATSPANAPSASPTLPIPDDSTSPRLISTNPFLDNYQPAPEFVVPTRRTPSPPKTTPYAPGNNREATVHARNAAELINGLTLSERPVPNRNFPISQSIAHGGTTGTARHRVTHSGDEEGRVGRSNDDDRRIRREPREARDYREPSKINTATSSKSPEKREHRRPVQRRNSETSILDVLDDERKNKSSGQRGKDGKQRDPKSREGRSGKPTKSSRRVDLIDKLDVTGIYGTATFHHDGPFDACNPHRNRRGARAAPMQAFAEGSANNVLGGSGPVNKQIDFDQFHGRGAQGFTDYNATSHGIAADPYPGYRRGLGEPSRRGERSDIVDPKARTQYVVGSESAGLGTSTFLEGTPVSRATLQRTTSENENVPPGTNGLQRKKSLVQKIRGISRPLAVGGDYPGPAITPDQYIDLHTGGVISPTNSRNPQSGGGRAKLSERNPFFTGAVDAPREASAEDNNVPNADEEAHVAVTRARTTSSPQQPMARLPTLDNPPVDGAEGKTNGGGLLSRVKSLKGGRKTRPGRSGSASQAD